LDSKNIVITGVSSGIGRDALRLLHKKGYIIYGSVRNKVDADLLLNKFPERFIPMIFDVQDQNAVIQASKIVFSQCDKLSALINNAGVAMPGPIQFISENDFEKQIDINLKSVRRITNLFLPLLGASVNFEEKPGRIINISSVSGLFSSPFNGAYSITKHGLESLTDIYRRELHRYGIKVIAIEPGPIKTKIWKKNLNRMDEFSKTDYYDILQKADKMILNTEKNAIDVENTSKIILKCLTTKNPKTRYIIHKNPFLFKFFVNFIPDKIADWIVFKTLSKGNKQRPI
jgi:NAD(P)-dependent dehydrogenase (short-subunit alcohol dehydrogenase family)